MCSARSSRQFQNKTHVHCPAIYYSNYVAIIIILMRSMYTCCMDIILVYTVTAFTCTLSAWPAVRYSKCEHD